MARSRNVLETDNVASDNQPRPLSMMHMGYINSVVIGDGTEYRAHYPPLSAGVGVHPSLLFSQ